LSDGEAIALRVTMIGGQRYPDDFTVIWRGLPIGRIMQASGLPPHVSEWRWTCNFHGKQGDGSGSGVDLDDCKAKFRVARPRIRAAPFGAWFTIIGIIDRTATLA
jgi:hypothetical protein